MQPLRLPPLLVVAALLALASGCQSRSSAKRPPARYQDIPGSFTDLTARNAYLDERIKELTATGMSQQAAAIRASREWFARAPAAGVMPTPYELQRREAQADLTAYLTDRQKSGDR